MQTKAELEEWYKDPDPWGYETNPEDASRKETILRTLSKYPKFKRALDIGCGEGWITTDLPAMEIYGTEESKLAANRVPSNVTVGEPIGKYDLVTAMGVLYKQYDWQAMLDLITNHASGIVLTCNIKDWEMPIPFMDKQIYETEFRYREYIEKLRVFQW